MCRAQWWALLPDIVVSATCRVSGWLFLTLDLVKAPALQLCWISQCDVTLCLTYEANSCTLQARAMLRAFCCCCHKRLSRLHAAVDWWVYQDWDASSFEWGWSICRGRRCTREAEGSGGQSERYGHEILMMAGTVCWGCLCHHLVPWYYYQYQSSDVVVSSIFLAPPTGLWMCGQISSSFYFSARHTRVG